MKKILTILFSLIICFSIYGCKCNKNKPSLGVWWWDDSLDSKYLEFAKDNNVTEIYYCTDKFNEDTSTFINMANKKDIKVYLLAGEYNWLDNPTNLYKKIDKYIKYQKLYPNQKFAGIHLDIEPHQNPLFETNRKELIFELINTAFSLKEKYENINFDYDLPFWLNDKISFNHEEKEAYKHIIDIANRVFLMSYRDSAEEIYNISKEEIEYAQNKNKILFLSVETKSNEGDKVSFQEEGKNIMYDEIKKLRKLIPNNYGVSIHQIFTWKELKIN